MSESADRWFGFKRVGDGAPITFIRMGKRPHLISLGYGSSVSAGVPGLVMVNQPVTKEVAHAMSGVAGWSGGAEFDGVLLAPILDEYAKLVEEPAT